MPPPLPKALFATCDVVPGPTRHAAISQVALQALTRHFQVDAVTLKSRDLGHHEKTDRLRMMRIPAGKGDYLAQIDSFRRALIRQLEGEEYHLVQLRSLLIGAPIAKRKAEFGAKLLIEVGHLDSLEAPILHPQIGSNRAALDRIIAEEDLCLKEADIIVTPSRVLRDLLVERGRKNIHLVPDGVNIDAFDWLDVRPKTPPVILYAGALAPWQGLVTLVEAMEILSRDTPARLVIVHPGDDENWQGPIKNLINNLGIQQKIEFRSALHEEIPELLCQAEVCVAPYAKVSRNMVQGHFPLKLIEYMACKRPIVASRLPMVEEVLADNVEALLFQPGNAEDLAQKIQSLLKDRPLGQRLAENSYRRVREGFNASRTRRRYTELYRVMWEAAKEEFPASGLDVSPEREDDIRSSGTDAGSSSSSKKRPTRPPDDEATAIFSVQLFEEERAVAALSAASKVKTEDTPFQGLGTQDTTPPNINLLPSPKPEPKEPPKPEPALRIRTGANPTISRDSKPDGKAKDLTIKSDSLAAIAAKASNNTAAKDGAPKPEYTTKPKETPSRLEVAKDKSEGASLLARLRENRDLGKGKD